MADHECFGFSWEAGATECAGGLDPAYTAANGSNRRERCVYFTHCAAKRKEHNTRGLVHPSQLTSHQKHDLEVQKQQIRAGAGRPGVQAGVQAGAQVGTQQVRQPLQQPVQQPVQQYTQQPAPQYAQPQPQPIPSTQFTPMMVPPHQASLPWMVPMNFAPPASQMPGYLTVPEPVIEGQAWYTRLGLTVARGVLKATGHVVANFFDHNTLQTWHPPKNNSGGPQ